jgi:hypothetical protein
MANRVFFISEWRKAVIRFALEGIFDGSILDKSSALMAFFSSSYFF